jgi:hypothetical protein
MADLITVEFSATQNCFHIDELYSVCNKNLKSIFRKEPTDYILIGVFETRKLADDFIISVKGNVQCR